MNPERQQLPYWLFTFAVIFVLTLPVLIQDGMFMDAMLYTSVARNLAEGNGTFWFPHFNLIGLKGIPTFHEQPPLTAGIQSLFFVVLGDTMYTERIYVLCALALHILLIIAIWRLIVHHHPERKLGWLPLILWIIVPVVFWSFRNNMHENTMGIFILLSVYLYLKSRSVFRYSDLYVVLSGVSIFLASFSKGIPGFFPVVIPFFHWICFRRTNLGRTIRDTSILILIPVVFYSAFMLFPVSRSSLILYVQQSLFFRIHELPTVDNRFYIVFRLISELLLPFILTAVLYFILYFHSGYRSSRETFMRSLFFLFLGLAGSVPMMLTLVQKSFYLTPVFPLFAIGLGILIAEPLSAWTRCVMTKKRSSVMTWISGLLLAAVFLFSVSRIGRTSREKEVLHDIHLIGNYLKGATEVSVPVALWNDWSLQCYLMRYYKISLDQDHDDYFIVKKEIKNLVPPDYHKLEFTTLVYDVYLKTPE